MYQTAVVVTSTAAGYGLSYSLLRASGPAVNRYLAATAQPPGTDVGDALMSMGHDLGQIELIVLAEGVLMIAATLGGLMFGVALSLRLVTVNKK